MVAHEIGHTQQKVPDSEDDGKSNLLGIRLRYQQRFRVL